MCADHNRESRSPLERYEEMEFAVNAIEVSIDPNTSSQHSKTRIPAPSSSRNLFNRVHYSEEHAEYNQAKDSYESFLSAQANSTDNESDINEFCDAPQMNAKPLFDSSHKSNVNNSAVERDDQLTSPHVNLAHTTSAPAIIELTDEGKKRKRSDHDSSSSSNQLAPPNKSTTFIKNSVSFAPQDNRSTKTVGLTTATSTSNADTRKGDKHDMGTGPNDKPQRTPINPLAEPMWLATRKHLITKLKATLRMTHLQELLDQDVMPVEFFGADLLHRYYASTNGVLSIPMQVLIGKQAREKAELVHAELRETAAKEGKKVEYYTSITSQIYAHEEDPTFSDAEAALVRVLSFYERTETDRLNVQAAKEKSRQPLNEMEWTNLVCHPEVRPVTPGTSRDTSRGRKRNRSHSKEAKAKAAKQDNTPATCATASVTTTQAPTPA